MPWARSDYLNPNPPDSDDKAYRGHPLRTFTGIGVLLFAAWGFLQLWCPEAPILDVHVDANHVPLDHEVKPLRIPRQLVLTAKSASVTSLPRAVQLNVRRTLQLSPGIRLRFLGDEDCRAFIKAHFDAELLRIFDDEVRGSFRGDICRACVLAREGGFYLDLDVQLRVPLEDLVDSNTTFAAAFTEDAAILNAIMAAAPASEVMLEALRQIRAWYRWEVAHEDWQTSSQWLGPVTMLRALRETVKRGCATQELQRQQLQWSCGQHVVRLYQEHELECVANQSSEECPIERANSEFAGVRFGIFTPYPERRIVAWPRFAECSDWGCSAGGWDETMPMV